MKRLAIAAPFALLWAMPAMASPATATEHVVKDGETLNGIANRAGVAPSVIAKANGLKEPYALRTGQKLKIPHERSAGASAKQSGAKQPGARQSGKVHIVQDGETLNGIANRAGVSAQALAKANGLKEPYGLRMGQKLTIPGEGRLPARETAGSGGSKGRLGGTHVVRDGETLNGIANRAGVSAQALARANGLTEPYTVRTGQKLILPGTGAAAQAEERQSAPVGGAGEYVVKEGETLNGIANRAGVPRVVIAEANGLKEPFEVQAGQKLVIPRQRTHVVQDGETGFGIAYEYGVPFQSIAVANGLADDAVLKTGQKLVIPAMTRDAATKRAAAPAPVTKPSVPAKPAAATARFAWPLTGAVNSGFNSSEGGSGHNGIDIAATEGDPVKAAAGGIVIYAQYEKTRFGNLVIIDHGDKWHTAYGHLGKIAVKKGDTIRAGEQLGSAGSSGTATSTEVHFEIRRQNKPVDPVALLGPAR